MATTVSYKGATLTTATNQTKTLKTAGTYLEDDITVTDVSEGGSAIVVTEQVDETGGTNYIIEAVDLSDDTVSPGVLLNGYTAHNSSGQPITGSYNGSVNNQNKTVTPTTSQQTVTADSGYTGLGTVTVNRIPTNYIVPSGTKSITSNGTGIDVTEYAAVNVSVSSGSPSLQDKTVSPTTSQQTIEADSGYDGLGTVTVNAISPLKSSSDLTASGATVTAPAGYYSSNASKSVSSGTVTAPSSISGTSATVSTGTNTLTLTKTVSVTPNVTTAGYISSGTAGNASVSLTASVDIRNSSSLSVSGDTVTAPAGYYASSASKAVASGTAGTPTATKGTVSNHSISVTPSVTNVTGYITGSTKTGTAVSVSASELVSGSETKTTNGTYDVTNLASLVVAVPIVTYYTGSSTPSSSLGSNGDIYLKTS